MPIYNTGDSAYNVNRITPVHVEDSRVTPPLGGYDDGSLGKELTDMRRKIRAQREKEIYAQKELQRNILDGIAITLLILLVAATIGGLIWLAISQGKL